MTARPVLCFLTLVSYRRIAGILAVMWLCAGLGACGNRSPERAAVQPETESEQASPPKDQSGSQEIETRIGRLSFTHDFANGFPTDATLEKLYDERDFQRACQAYLWSLPAVSFMAWHRGVTRSLGASNGQIVAILSYEARRGILTANATTPYYLGFADLSSGPFVLVMPARGVQGGISDTWQNSIPDTEKPGKYLVVAPGQTVPDHVGDYIVRHSPTVSIFLGVRLTDTDPQRAKEALAQLQMYPYAQREKPPKTARLTRSRASLQIRAQRWCRFHSSTTILAKLALTAIPITTCSRYNP